MLNTPILFLIFRRPEKTQRVFNAIRKAQPKQLFVGADGPRYGVEGEKELCEQARKIIEQVDWDCEVKTLFQEKNVGSKIAESSAMTWFFDNVEKGIILEDDCLPNQSFFTYCETLLEYYKDDARIMHISGENLLDEIFGDASYYFAKIEHCWGWATWRRAWKYYDVEMKNYPKFRETNQIANVFSSKSVQNYWIDIFDRVYANEIDAWDYIWTYTIFSQNGLCINSNYNLVSNIGFGDGGTYCLDANNPLSNRPAQNIDYIVHPEFVLLNQEALKKTLQKVFLIAPFTFETFLQYAKIYPLFFLRKDFWYKFLNGEDYFKKPETLKKKENVKPLSKPVLFLIFNRLEITKKVFEQIRAAKPPRLYIASDGARDSKYGEKELVEKIRNWVVGNIDWDCEVKTLFRDENLGCGKAVSGAITWFFSQEPDGIILEDDCLPSQSFFGYCEKLLDYYKDDNRVWHISGNQFIENFDNGASYYFAQIEHCWGWASWADRWQNFKYEMKNFNREDIKNKNFSNDKRVQKYWLKILKRMQYDNHDVWDYQWTLEIIRQNGLCINPSRNLVSNIGVEGTHYSNREENKRLNLPIYEIEEIVHPENVEIDKNAVKLIYRNVFNIKLPTLKDCLLYIKKYPFFYIRKDFWYRVFTGEEYHKKSKQTNVQIIKTKSTVKPVLFLIFNRVDTTKRVFEQIRAAKPPRLYVASDGARDSKYGEKELVEKIRNWVLENIDWDCEVKTLFRDENLGCGRAVSGAITWFFEQEPDGIILEDDCLPSQSFFSYCEELLDYYKDDKRVWHIAGENPLGVTDSTESYYFAKIMHCWGWASWADRWQHYKFDLSDYNEKNIKNFSSKIEVKQYWLMILNKMKNHEIDTWDYQWAFEIVKQKGFCINPSKNLISNIGFEGTHYSSSESDTRLSAPTYVIDKIVHPLSVKFNHNAVDSIYRNIFGIKPPTFKQCLLYIKRYPLFFFRKDFWQKVFG